MRRSLAWVLLALVAALVLRRWSHHTPGVAGDARPGLARATAGPRPGLAPPAEVPGLAAAEPPSEVAPAPAEPRVGVAPAEPPPTAAGAVGSRNGTRRGPSALRGTSPDGALAVDDEGHLLITRDTRRFFDYFVADAEELRSKRLKHRLAIEIGSRLPAGPATQAVALLHRYLAYLASARALPADEDPAERAETLRTLRRDMLGPDVAAAFFSDDEALESGALERRRIAAEPSLSPEERADRVAAVEDRLPPALRTAREQAVAPLRLMQEEARLRSAGAAPGEIRALRERMFGAAAADRLEALDRERAEWQSRLDDYRVARDAILADASRSPAGRVAAIEALRAERFTPKERLRVGALDR